MNRFPTRPSDPSRARTLNDRMSALEDGVRGHIASYLPPSDILAIGPVNNQPALSIQQTSALRASAASAVYTRGEFMGLLGPEGTQFNDGSNSIRSLPPALRAVPLSALAARISYLPAGDRQATTGELLTAMDEIPAADRTTTFNAQRAAAQMVNTASAVNNQAEFMGLLGPEGTQFNDGSNSIRSLPPALRAVPLSALAARISYLPAEDRQATTVELLTAMDEIPAADRTATFNAQRAAAQMINTASEVNNQSEFTALLGPTETPVTDAPDSIRSLPMPLRAGPLLALGLRVNSSPQAGARQAMTAQFLAAYNEIYARDASTPLNAMARAGRDSSSGTSPRNSVRRGVNVQYAALFNGITDVAQITQLGIDAAVSRLPGSPRTAVHEGGNVQDVARRHGMPPGMAVTTLELYAANSTHDSSARTAAHNGANPEQIRQQFGFTDYGIGLMAQPPILDLGD